MTADDSPAGPLDVATLSVVARRAVTHPLVERWAFQPDAMSPRRLELHFDAGQYPSPVASVRLDVRWFEGGDYTFHYLESDTKGRWQCRWDRHCKPDAPNAHVHPPPDAGSNVEPSDVDSPHHLGVLFAVLDRIEERLAERHED